MSEGTTGISTTETRETMFSFDANLAVFSESGVVRVHGDIGEMW